MVHFDEFLKTWSLRSNSVTRQVSFNKTKIGEKWASLKPILLFDYDRNQKSGLARSLIKFFKSYPRSGSRSSLPSSFTLPPGHCVMWAFGTDTIFRPLRGHRLILWLLIFLFHCQPLISILMMVVMFLLGRYRRHLDGDLIRVVFHLIRFFLEHCMRIKVAQRVGNFHGWPFLLSCLFTNYHS